MTLHPLDYAIVGFYLVGLIVISLWVARRASRGAEDYFLGGKRLPWWALGASGMSSNLDAAGTMTIITLIYLYGLHGFWIEMRGGVVLPIAVFLAFMGKWHRRSAVMTTGEWMLLRFGEGWQGRAARYTAAATYLVITIGMVTFFLEAAGKFLAVFLPFDETTCAVSMALLALGYTMISGLYGVIWTDVFQAFLIGFGAIYVSVLAAGYVTPELWSDWPGAAYNTALPQLTGGLVAQEPGAALATESYAPFGLFLLFWAGKGLLEGLGGSGGSAYMAQRFYAARDDQTVQKLCMLWTVLFSFRWPMVLGFAVLAIHMGIGRDDPEQVLPAVLTSSMIPIGVTGVLVAAIFAASMSTFDSTINAGASYVVRDLYLPWRERGEVGNEGGMRGGNEGAVGDREQVRVGYVASILIVAAGLTVTLTLASGVLAVWKAIVVQFFPAFLLPFALRWYWSRFNGLGFVLGTVTGFAGAFALWVADLGLNDVATIGTVLGCSAVGCLLGTLAGGPVPTRVLQSFYEQVRPFGLWPGAWKRADRSEHRGDMVRLAVAVVWQVSTFLLPMFALLHMWWPAAVAGGLFVLLGGWLWRGIPSGAAGAIGTDGGRGA